MASLPALKFSFAFDGSVWNIALDHEQSLLVIEVRLATSRQVRYAAIDLATDRLLWQEYMPGSATQASWWISLIGVYNGHLLLHRYTNSQKPEPQGIICVDVKTNTLLWEQSNWIYLQHAGAALLVYQMGEDSQPVYQKLDLATGTLLGEPQSIEADKPTAEPADLQYPQHYTEENPYFTSIASFIAAKLSVQPVKAFDYAECQGLIVVSYYLYDNNEFLNKIVVFNQSAQVVLHEPVATHLNGIGIDTFMVRRGCLIFVKEKKEIVSYALV